MTSFKTENPSVCFITHFAFSHEVMSRRRDSHGIMYMPNGREPPSHPICILNLSPPASRRHDAEEAEIVSSVKLSF